MTAIINIRRSLTSTGEAQRHGKSEKQIRRRGRRLNRSKRVRRSKKIE
jgi:hypothetical protein